MSATDTPGVILSRIFKAFLYQLNMGIDRYQYSMLSLIRQLSLDNNHKVSSLINGLSNEIFGDNITWRVFVKSLVFLGTKNFTISIDTGNSRTPTSHTVDLSSEHFIKELFFSSTSSKEETKLGAHLKTLLNKLVEENSLEKDVTLAIDKHIEYLKLTDQYTNKSLKGNILKEVKGKSITWKVLIKILVVYEITEPVIAVTIHDRLGKEHTSVFRILLEKSMLQ